MPEKIVVGPINKGIKTDREPFAIDNDSFPVLINAYQWRGRIKRKRGTSFLGRLSRFLGVTDGGGNLIVTISPAPILSGIVSFTVGSNIFTDPGGASPVILLTNGPGTATLNRTTGVLTITGSNAATSVIYYPSLPVMGLEELVLSATAYPGTLAFDTTYSYNILTTFPYSIYDVSFYKNPLTGTYPGYVQKTNWTPTTWNGKDYQQFWTVNYQGALWATNGINIPFSTSNIGMQYAGPTTTPALTVATRLTATTMSFTVVGNPLVVGDFVFANEFTASAGGDATALNFQTGYVTTAGNTFTVTFPDANIPAGTYTPGILQYLTNRSDPTLDNIRWYDGDPTNANPTNPTLVNPNGWVNFMPPLSQFPFSIADLPPLQYYLVGCRMIFPFRDRLLFIGPVVQASNGFPIYLQDTVVFSQNGTPYYTASFTGNPDLATTVFNPILVPINQTASPAAYWSDQTGFGGFITAGIDQQILTTEAIGDELIMGMTTTQLRFVFTGNDIIPFNFYLIDSELGSGSTFSSINMGKGVITRGERGYILTNQVGAQRIDVEIPDQVFEISLTNNGAERFCAQRDFISEWIYFTYPSNEIAYIYPNQTLQYNYRDNSWAIFNECYTTYGKFRKQTGFTWATVGTVFPTWAEWNQPWNAGLSTLEQPDLIGGNQQGFILVKDEGTGEGNSLTIQNIVGNLVTSPNHCLNNGDYIIISGALGTVGGLVNGRVFSVYGATTNTFMINPSIASATYLGGGLIQRLYVPFIQTKQFPLAWGMGRKTRIGMQQYLLSTTSTGQIQLLIFLSQNADSPYNSGAIVPFPGSINDGLIYSTTLFTCPESTNLGLTPANSNLQTPTALSQQQIWHRINTSLIGDTVQIGFTMSDEQMRTLTPTGNSFAITNITQTNPAVITTTGNFPAGVLIKITGVVGMIELNGNSYVVLTSNSTTTTIQVDSTLFTAYISDGLATQIAPIIQFDEIELHGFNLDVSPSQMLV